MPFTNRITEYTIDLRLPPEERWAEVIAAERKPARAIARQVVAELRKSFPGYGNVLGATLKKLIAGGYRLSGGRYREEMAAWAEALNLPVDDVLLMQLGYELSHMPGYFGQLNPFGCTAGISHAKGLGMFHVRTLDWGLDLLGPATRVYRFKAGRREFLVVGVLGLVGALSGMLPGQYSLTVNFAPPSALPRFQFGPLFLVREVLETCDSFAEAVRILREMPVACNVFFAVCGAREGEACIIERMPDEASVRRYRGTPLVQANHFQSRRFADDNACIMEAEDEDTMSLFEDSRERQSALEQSLARLPARMDALEEAAVVLPRAPVLNEQTHQHMIFCPKSGTLKVWRRKA